MKPTMKREKERTSIRKRNLAELDVVENVAKSTVL